MEYVPVDFDVEQAKRAKEALDAILASIALPTERKSAATRAGGIYHELLEKPPMGHRPHRRRFASACDVRLPARLER